MLGAILTFVGVLLSVIIGVNQANQRYEEEEKARQQQADYNKEALEQQAELNKEAAEYNYEMETNYKDRLDKLMNAGLNSHYAAQILGGINASYQPPMVQAQQATTKQQPDFSTMLQGLMTGVPNQIGQGENRKIQREQNKFKNEIEKQRLQIQKDVAEINKLVAEGKLTIEQGQYAVWEKIQYQLVPNPLGKDLPDIPYWQAEAISKSKQFQQDIEMTDLVIQEKDVNLEELRKQVQRNDVTWQWEIERRAHEKKMESYQLREIAASVKILENDASPRMLSVRYLLQYYEFLNKKQQAALQAQIEKLPPGPGKEAAQTLVAYLPIIFKFIEAIPK